jgi:hypothetical protein
VQVQSRLRWFDVATLCFAAILSFATVAVVTLGLKEESQGVAVIFAPWTSASDAMTRSVEPGARFVRFGAFDFIAVIEPQSADYMRRVRSNGAWMIADPAALAACLKPFTRSKT